MAVLGPLFCPPQKLPGIPPTPMASHFPSFSAVAIPLIRFHVGFSWGFSPDPISFLSKLSSQAISSIPRMQQL